MTKTDWLVLAGYALLDAGVFLIYRPLALIFAGAVCLLLARTALGRPTQNKEAE